MEDKLAIIKNQFGLDVEPLELPFVYKVLNTDKEVNVNKLLSALKKATVFYSKDYKRIEENKIRSKLASVHCIILDYKNTELTYKYAKSFQDTIIDEYNEERKLGDTLGILTDI